MVKNLNAVSFSGFGRILDDRSNCGVRLPQGVGWQELALSVTAAESPVRQAGDGTFLDFVSGLTVLAVSKDGQSYQYFYLDKALQLRSGIWFALLPYAQESSAARMVLPAGATLALSGELHRPQDFRLTRRLQVGSIYTFFYQEKERGFFFRGEAHDMLELTYVDKGQLHSVVSGSECVLEQGELTLYGSGQWHMQYADIDRSASFVTVTFDLLEPAPEALLGRKFRISQWAAAILKQMLREQEREAPLAEDMIVCLLNQLLLTLLREGQDARRPLQASRAVNSENVLISRAQQYISENVRQKLSVPLVAREVGVSPSYLTALFHRSLQISPGEYIRRCRLQESREMIREGVMNFTQISEALQYSNVHHFSRQFKEKFGLTPTEYARSIR